MSHIVRIKLYRIAFYDRSHQDSYALYTIMKPTLTGNTNYIVPQKKVPDQTDSEGNTSQLYIIVSGGLYHEVGGWDNEAVL
jgi:hypothetical protein